MAGYRVVFGAELSPKPRRSLAMYRPSPEPTPPDPLLNSLAPALRRRLTRSWPLAFRQHILPLIPDDLFADDFHPEHGAPNKANRTVLALFLLQHLFDYTDEHTLDAVCFDLRWHVALGLLPGQFYCCQKTLHNYRARLRHDDRARSFFQRLTGELLQALGLDSDRQRLDSTHIHSAIADLSRLGVACATLRLFLRVLARHRRADYDALPPALRQRYFTADDHASHFEHTDKPQTQRRLPVAGRDLWRLVQRFGPCQEVAAWPEFALLQRILGEQFLPSDTPVAPLPDDADASEGPVPLTVRPAKQVASDSLQNPHDPDATYGKKGKGYEVQVCETFGNKTAVEPAKPEMITHISVTRSCDSDVQATLPILDDLEQRGLRPGELRVDANFTSSEVVLAAREDGTQVKGPVKGNAPLPRPDEVTLGDFVVDEAHREHSRCPGGKTPVEQEVGKRGRGEDGQAGSGSRESGLVALTFLLAGCVGCIHEPVCPVRQEGKEKAGGRIELRTTRGQVVVDQRRREQSRAEFAQEQTPRAGIEGTNSELKRGQGLGRLRVRGQSRVELQVYLKGAACNVKRAANYWARKGGDTSARDRPMAVPREKT